MADNSTLPVSGGGTEIFANDDISSVKYPRSKLSLGADGSATDAVGGAGSVSAAVQRMTLASDDPAVTVLGAKTDAKNTATDTTSVSAVSIWKQISASVQAAASALAGTITVATHAVTQSGSWTVTANAGTNLNTSALATESGGNLAAIATSASVIDDWDETDRAKVNPIVGQAGVAAGNGPVSAATVRVALADISAGEYETVAAGQTAQVIGPTGAAGDYLSHVIVSPATVGCGAVTILDNATTIVAFPGGGTSPLSNLIPFIIPVGIVSTSGAWKITTGANVSCTAVGNFT